MVFIFEDPLKSIPKTIQVIEEFGKVAGFYLNQSKLKLLFKNVSKEWINQIKQTTECEIVTKIKYLGIILTNKNLDLFKNNYEKLWIKIDKELDHWGKLNLSFMGKIAAVKRQSSLKFFFLLQTIPVVKDARQFELWQRRINKFIWNGEKA